ncbi:MAG: flagellar assembly protein FliW [Firmicutes bacterium]|nr:flagellar assembly protein FliW [Bacillota bacterium]
MRVVTSRFGELEVQESDIITFPRGILGFESIKRYILLGDGEPFGFLQSLDEPDLTFVVIDPRVLVHDYRVDVPRVEAEEIGIRGQEETAILAIVTIPEDPDKMTANLQAPLLINCVNRQAKQLVLGEGDYNIRHPILATVDRSA